MGRWETDGSAEGAGFFRKRNYTRIAKYVIFAGFVIVGVVVLSVFIPRSGLYVEIIERSEVMGTMQTISVRVSNNNFGSLDDVAVQFGDQGQVQPIGNMGPFSSVMVTPPNTNELNFDKVIVTANNGEVRAVKTR